MFLRRKKPADKIKPRIQTAMPTSVDAESSWRMFKIMSEFVTGFEFLKKYDAAVTFFGSARCKEGDAYYDEATKLAAALAKRGFAVITGGGPGIMEAANRGAVEVGGQSIGINIQLPKEQRTNRYVVESQAFHYFFTRKVMLAYASEVYIFFPGGYGTLDELFELMTLVQTKKISNVPIILVGKEFWQPMFAWIKEKMFNEHHAIDQEDLSLHFLVDTASEAVKTVDKLIRSGKIGQPERPVEYTHHQKIMR